MRKSIRKVRNEKDIFPAATVSPLDAHGALRNARQEKKFDLRKILILAMVTVLIGCATRQNLKEAEHFAQTTKPFTIAVLPDTQFYCDSRLKLSAKWGNDVKKEAESPAGDDQKAAPDE